MNIANTRFLGFITLLTGFSLNLNVGMAQDEAASKQPTTAQPATPQHEDKTAGQPEETKPPTKKEIADYIKGFLEAENFDDEAGAFLLQNTPLTKEQFVSIIKKSNGEAPRTMGAFAGLASSPTALIEHYPEILEAAEALPDSPGAKYLASNRYLEKKQFDDLTKFSKENPDTLLAYTLTQNSALPASNFSEFIKAASDDPRTALAEGTANSQNASPAQLEMLSKKAAVAPDSRLAAGLSTNKKLPSKTLSFLAGAAVNAQDSSLAKGIASQPGMPVAELKTITIAACASPDSKLAEGEGQNRSLSAETCGSLLTAVTDKGDLKLSVSLSKNPNITDQLFNALYISAKKNPNGQVAAGLVSPHGPISTKEERMTRLINLAKDNQDTDMAFTLVENPDLPQSAIDELIKAALAGGDTKLSQGFLQSIKEQRFRGTTDQRNKFLEAALNSQGAKN